MITYKQIDKSYLKVYDNIPMLVNVKSKYSLKKINKGLGGIILKEIPVEEYLNRGKRY